MSDTSTIHVPLEPTIRKKFTTKAKELGFDSAQAYLRVIIKAAVDGRRIDLDIDEWGQPSPEAAARLNKWTAEALKASEAGELPSFTDAKSMMEYLQNEAH
ncbi:MAG TPA: hypothetical protein VMR28_00045 [Candidatus Saccharimonadales bacterium]|nr:hypothetical protein [Candidatus Saccharimonadales bacterium]